MKKTVAVILWTVGLLGAGSGMWFVLDMNTLADTVGEVRQSVVHIEKVGSWEGSGFVLSEDGIICTAKHVVEGGGTFVVTFDDGTKVTTTCALQDNEHDIGFLKVKTLRPLTSLPVRRFSLRAGDQVFIMGSPLGFDYFNSVTLGIISAARRGTNNDYGLGWQVLFQSDARAYPGNSGGPVFDLDGRVVGVLVAGVDASMNFSVPVSVFMDNMPVVRLMLTEQRFSVPFTPEVNETYTSVTPVEPNEPEHSNPEGLE